MIRRDSKVPQREPEQVLHYRFKGGPDGASEKIEELTVRILLGLNKTKQHKVRPPPARRLAECVAPLLAKADGVA